MSSKHLQDILESTDKKIGHATNPLARLWRTILYENNIQHGAFDSAITRYLERLEEKNIRSKKEQSREKGNLVKELSGNSLTFKNFVKGLQVLNPKKVRITVDIEWMRGRTTVHHVDLDLLNDAEEPD